MSLSQLFAIVSPALWAGLALVSPVAARAGEKYAIILQAGRESHDGAARALYAFLYAQELRGHGHRVALIFDGAGTEWAETLNDPASESSLKPLYQALKRRGLVEVVCDFCAEAFRVKGRLQERQVPLIGESAGHPNIATWANGGYQLIIL